MRKIINDPEAFTDETLEGILAAHPGALRRAAAGSRALVRADAGRRGKVGIITGGGSGHLPVFLGYVGLGLCDGVAVGNTFSSPSAEQIAQATRAVDGGAGVLYLYGNYGGDIYNFEIAADLVAADGITTNTVLAADDVASAPSDHREARRGVAGMIYPFKIAGASAERGDNLEQVTTIARRVADRTRTMGVGLSPTILPAAGEPTFHLDEGEMEVGIGIHGEPGVHRGPLETADEIAQRLVGAVLDDLDAPTGSTVSVLVDGLGATPLEELYILYRRAAQLITERGLSIHSPFVGNYVTSLEAAGASISVLLLDAELTELLDAPAASPFFRVGAAAVLDIESTTVDTATDAVASSTDDPGAPPAPFVVLLGAVLDRLPKHAEELRELDAALGDGDLGITVSEGSRAAKAAIGRNPSLPPAEQLRRAGAAFASANPSTFAALIGGAVVSAAADLQGDPLDPAVAVSFVAAVADRIRARGGAEPGDKTVVDALLAGAQNGSMDLDSIIESVQRAVDEGATRTSKRGRAAWLQERSVGLRDPGMVAYLRFLEDLRAVAREFEATTEA